MCSAGDGEDGQERGHLTAFALPDPPPGKEPGTLGDLEPMPLHAEESIAVRPCTNALNVRTPTLRATGRQGRSTWWKHLLSLSITVAIGSVISRR